MTIIAGRPAKAPSKAPAKAPPVYIPPPVQHVAAGVIHHASAPTHVAPASTRTGANPRGVAIPQHAPRPTVNDRAARTLGTGYNPRGVAIRPQGKLTVNDHKALVDTFNHQSDRGKAAIVQGAVRHPSPEGDVIINYLKANVVKGGKLNLAAGTGKQVSLGPSLSSVLTRGFVSSKSKAPDVSDQAAGSIPGIGTVLPFGGQKGAEGLLKNTASDAWNLTPQTIEGLYGTGKDLVQGKFAKAGKSVAEPFIQLAEHPVSSFYQHPLDSALMLSGAKSLIGKGLGGIARSGALGEDLAKGASTARAPLHIGTVAGEPSPILEARSFSKDVTTKAFQKAHDAVVRARGRNPDVTGPKPRALPQSLAYALKAGTEAKLRRIADEMTSTRQAMGRQDRARVRMELMKQAPKGAARDVVTHVLQGIIRKPETAVEDATKEMNRLKAAQTGKRTPGEIMNRRQVKSLDAALKEPGALSNALEAAARIRPQINAQDASLVSHGLLDSDQAMRAKLIPYAQAHLGAHLDPITQTFKNADGSTLTTQEILDHLHENGVPDPAYVGHFPGKISPARFYSTYKMARGTLGGMKRTGSAFTKGAYDHTFEGLSGQVASRAEAVTKAELHDRVVNRLGITPAPKQMRALLQHAGAPEKDVEDAVRTGLFTPKEARIVANAARVDDNGNEIPGALHLTPISAAPRSALAEVKDLQHPAVLANMSQLELKALSAAIEDAASRTDNARNVTLIPTVAAQRFAEQFAKTDTILKSVGRATQQFRRTVLPYSTHWMLQIGSEAGIRALIAGVLDPRMIVDGNRMMHALEDTQAGRAALQEGVNATFYNKRDPLAIMNPHPGVVSSAAHAFPPTRLIIAMHTRYADMIGSAMGSLEHQARLMGLGKFAHNEAAEFSRSWRSGVLLEGDVIQELATKLKNDPALVAKLGRQIDDTFGKYNKFTPTQRAMVQSFMPFLPWYLNAAKYVLYSLPIHHPVSSAVLASLRQTVNQDIADGKQAPLNAYAMEDLGRLSPFGIFTPPSTTPSTGAALEGQQISGAFLPQIEGSFYNLAGVNSFGSGPLKQAPSGANYKGDTKPLSGPALAASVENMIESFLPGVRYGREALAGGKPTYGTSTIVSPQPEKGQTAGNAGSITNRIFNPLYSFERAQSSKGPPFASAKQQAAAYAKSAPASSGSSRVVIPGRGSTDGVVMPGRGGTSGVVMP